MGSHSSKNKTRDSPCHIYYAVKLKNQHKVSVFDSDDFKPNVNVTNDESDMYLPFDYEDMNKNNSSISRPKLNRLGSLEQKSSERLKDAGQFWGTASRESVENKRSDYRRPDVSQLNWDEHRKRLTMSPSKGGLAWTNMQDNNSKRNVRSTAAQAGSNVNVRENSIFKSRSNKGSTSSVSSQGHREAFSDSKLRSQNENYDSSSGKKKRSLKNIDLSDGLFETKAIYSSDNLSDGTNKTRDLDFRLKGGGLNESKSKNRSFEIVDLRPKKTEDDKERDVINETDKEKNNLTNDYIDARWQALCSSNDKEQVLVPCPTCGRRFSEEAAYRHFPICSRVKDKVVAPPKISKTTRSPSSPSFINVTGDEFLGSKDKRDDHKKTSKPIVFTFTRGGQKIMTHRAATISREKKSRTEVISSNKRSADTISPKNSKKGSGNSLINKSDNSERKIKKRKVHAPKSDGVRKSASIWRKSTKEFKTIAEAGTKLSTVKESNSSTSEVTSTSSKADLSVKKPKSNESRGNGNASLSDGRICPTCGRLSNTSVDRKNLERSKSRTRRCFNGKYKTVNNKVTRSAKDMRELESIPQHLSIKDNVNSKMSSKLLSSFDSFNDKSEPCFYCGRLVRRSVLDSHSFLCERIKNIEVMISKDQKKQTGHMSEDSLDPCDKHNTIYKGSDCLTPNGCITPNKYRLVVDGRESPTGSSHQLVATMKCPCCSQALRLLV